MGKYVCFLLIFFFGGIHHSYSQKSDNQYIKGTVSDKESGKPVSGANILVIDSNPPSGVITGPDGKFRLSVPFGRVSLKITFLGYEDLLITNIPVNSAKEIEINAGLQEKVVTTGEVVVKGALGEHPYLNPMASVSTHTLRSEDALHYAGGFYDPSRMVNSYAGVVTSNSDYSNEIVIRGNSSRGLLWRLEGIEIPNPNHFSDARGGSGGAFSSVTSNVIDNFDFFTGAFPAEYGNAFSGVMDLNLRKGNTDRHEFAFQTGMIGAELAAEGPFIKKGKASYLVNGRFTNFKILNDLNLIDLGETNYAPRTKDLVFNLSFPSGKSGYFNIFGLYAASALGKTAERDISKWTSSSDQWEESERQSSGIAGIKNLLILQNSGSYIKTVVAFTTVNNSYNEGYVDSSYVRDDSYYYSYTYPSLRISSVLNHKFNARNSARAGFYYNYLMAEMSNFRKTSTGYDTLVMPDATGSLSQAFLQWKLRLKSNLEMNTGLHLLNFSTNNETSVEPRFGLRWQYMPGRAFIAGAGIHSRAESYAVYYSRIKTSSGSRLPLNEEIGLSKAFHLVGGVEMAIKNDITFRFEGYYQKLYNIPIENRKTSRYSALNSSEGLPETALQNVGTGFNRGVELTLEKSFTHNYYFLTTLSLFNSKYKAGDGFWYNTYYNTRFVSNLLGGKDFPFGSAKRNRVGLNGKLLVRGGYRYTPVDIPQSLRNKKIINDKNRTYDGQLPDFVRMDAGINFRRNQSGYSWIVMLDIQNALNRKNVFRKRFSYENGGIKVYNVYSFGIVPVFNFRIEF
jgi:hypothetical protein